jgi:5S rRNA maturation endonuclease (ribonuclease M5)
LVNTPESGEYVRFDIRPLQEFFAAEHIYRSGDPNDLDKKIRTIASDSHWREVIIFCSAH